MADENIRFDIEYTKIDQYDYSKYTRHIDDDDKEPA
jgi:hypothetical protein